MEKLSNGSDRVLTRAVLRELLQRRILGELNRVFFFVLPSVAGTTEKEKALPTNMIR